MNESETTLPTAMTGISRSSSISNLAKALSSAQGKMKAARKGEFNPFFKSNYANLAAVIEAGKEQLASVEIAYTQSPGQNSKGELYVDTLLFHSSGEWLEGRIVMHPVKMDPQSIGSLISYARRYSLQSILGMASEDDDDDAELSTPRRGKGPLPEGSFEEIRADGELTSEDKEKILASEKLLAEYLTQLDSAKTKKDLEAIGKKLVIRGMMTSDVATLRERYTEAMSRVKGSQ